MAMAVFTGIGRCFFLNYSTFEFMVVVGIFGDHYASFKLIDT